MALAKPRRRAAPTPLSPAAPFSSPARPRPAHARALGRSVFTLALAVSTVLATWRSVTAARTLLATG